MLNVFDVAMPYSRYEVDMLPAFEGQEACQLLRSIGVEQARPLSCSRAPLSVKANVIGEAESAPRRGHRRAARERAGIPSPSSATLRTASGPENALPEYRSHNRRRLCDILLSCPGMNRDMSVIRSSGPSPQQAS
jgi:hypothetical protein